MTDELISLLRDEEYREELSKAAYYRERVEESIVDREHTGSDDDEHWALSWDSLSDFAKRPYRTAIATACDEIATIGALV